MNTRRSARHLLVLGESETESTVSLFIKNHTSPEHLLQQIEGLAHSGQNFEAQALCEHIINAEHILIRSADFFVRRLAAICRPALACAVPQSAA